jgi:7-cyano-7-deazaguanine synthase
VVVTIGLLLSGGLDSTAIAYWQRPEFAFTLDYGQRAAPAEIRAAAAVAGELNMRHEVIRLPMTSLGSGDMSDTDALEIAPAPEWWPFRNQMLVTLAAMRAVALRVDRLLIGCLRTDSHHVDGSPSFIALLDSLLRIQEGGLSLGAPAITMDAAELIRESAIPRDLLAWAHSCHVGEFACGECRGCIKHYETLKALGWDPY